MRQKEPRIYKSESWLGRCRRFEVQDIWLPSKRLPPWCPGAVGRPCAYLPLPPSSLFLPPPPHIFHRLKKLRHIWTQRESNGANETRGLDFALAEDTMGLQWMISLTVKCKSWPWTLIPVFTLLCLGVDLL